MIRNRIKNDFKRRLLFHTRPAAEERAAEIAACGIYAARVVADGLYWRVLVYLPVLVQEPQA